MAQDRLGDAHGGVVAGARVVMGAERVDDPLRGRALHVRIGAVEEALGVGPTGALAQVDVLPAVDRHLEHGGEALRRVPEGLHLQVDGLPVVLVAAPGAREPDALLPQHLQDVRPVGEAAVVGVRAGQAAALEAVLLAQQVGGAPHLVADLVERAAPEELNALVGILDADALEQDVVVGVLLEVEERVARESAQLVAVELDRAAAQEECGGNAGGLVDLEGAAEEGAGDVDRTRLDVVADQEGAAAGRPGGAVGLDHSRRARRHS